MYQTFILWKSHDTLRCSYTEGNRCGIKIFLAFFYLKNISKYDLYRPLNISPSLKDFTFPFYFFLQFSIQPLKKSLDDKK